MNSNYQAHGRISLLIRTVFNLLIIVQPIISFSSKLIHSHVRPDHKNQYQSIPIFHLNKCPVRIQTSLTSLSATAAATPMSYSDGDTAKEMSFRRRMREIALGRERRSTSKSILPSNKQSNRSRVRTVETIEEYKKNVGDERNKITVVRFFATWCKVCICINLISLLFQGF